MVDVQQADLLLIQTGGTIDKDYPKTVGGYAFEICDAASRRIMERISPVIRYQQITACQKDSQDMTDDDREHLWRMCKESLVARIVITHGTDTMIDTALFLQSRGLPEHHVIITGARIPETFKDTDADFNLGLAVGAVQMMTSPGVYVAMNGSVCPADDIMRSMTSGTFITRVKNDIQKE